MDKSCNYTSIAPAKEECANRMNFDPSQTIPSPGTKRARRQRSTGAAQVVRAAKKRSADSKKKSDSKSNGKSAKQREIPIFVQKTRKILEECDPELAAWSSDGDTFTIKNPDEFQEQMLPEFFEHNNFSSFARQLNFYGFKKIQNKPICNKDYNETEGKHITFYHDFFSLNKPDLMTKIRRSTDKRGKNNYNTQEEISALKNYVTKLEREIVDLKSNHEERLTMLENKMNQPENQLPPPTFNMQQPASSLNVNRFNQPTLAPHPKTKVAPPSNDVPLPPNATYAHGVSSTSISSFLRGFSNESGATMDIFINVDPANGRAISGTVKAKTPDSPSLDP